MSSTSAVVDKHSAAQPLRGAAGEDNQYEHMEEQLSSDGHLNFKYREFMRTYRECLVWARLLFADLHSSVKILRHLLLPWPGHSWSSAVLNCAAVSGREGTSVPALARLLLVGSGVSHVMVPGVITFGTAQLAYRHRYCHPLATCPSSKRPTLAADTQLLVGRTDSTDNQFLERYTSTKFGLSFISFLPGTTV